MDSLFRDLRYGLRMLARNPAFTAVAVLTLALGIGANTAIFSVIEAVLLRPLSYHDPSRLVLLADPQDPSGGVFLYKDLEQCKAQDRNFQDLAIYYRDSGFSRVTLSGPGEPEQIQGAFVSASFFSVMGVPGMIGRVFTAGEEARQERVVVLSHGLWLRRFGGSRDVVGRRLQIDGISSEIIGVMPETFQFPARDQQFWAPISTNPFWGDPALSTHIDPRHTRPFYARWQAIARLKAGVRLEKAQSEMNTIFTRLDRADPDANRGRGIEVIPLRVTLSGNTRLALLVLSSAVFFVLLIACSNVANLFLVRGTARNREISIRAALGAGRVRLLAQLLTESALLAFLAGGLGLFFAVWGARLLVAFGPPEIPRLEQVRLDAGVLAFAAAASLLSAIIFGLAPAWKIARSNPHGSLKPPGGGAAQPMALRRTHGLLTVSQFALAIVLLNGAGLLVRSFLAVRKVDPGFNPQAVLVLGITLPGATSTHTTAFYDRVLDRARALPGVRAAGAVSGLFEYGTINNLGLRAIEGREPEPKERWTPLVWTTIRGDFFQAMGTPLLLGRYFSAQDVPVSPLVAIIDESMARRYWPGQNPLGKRFKGQDPRGRNDDWLTVIGVVPDMRRAGLEKYPVPHIYEWYAQSGEGDRTSDVIVRTTGDVRAVAAALRIEARGLSSTAILSPVTTMEQQLSDQLSPRRFETGLLGLFSIIAVLLASVGIYGVLQYSVTRRTHEMGIRMALGARPRDVLKLVAGEGAKLALLGIAIGTVVAMALTKLMASLLFGVTPTDPLTFAAVSLLLTAAAVLASYFPARRATKVDPMVALRYE
jgi:putative ABC transport system permease protein